MQIFLASFLAAAGGAFFGALFWFQIACSDELWGLATVATSIACAFGAAEGAKERGHRLRPGARALLAMAVEVVCGAAAVIWFAWGNWDDPL
jgi:hypothetical protein